MKPYRKIVIPLFFATLFALAFIFFSSAFFGSEPESIQQNVKADARTSESKPGEILLEKDPKKMRDPQGWTEKEKEEEGKKPLGKLEDGSRSLIVSLKDIDENDLKEANPQISKAQISSTLHPKEKEGPELNSYYKNAISKKADKLIEKIANEGGRARLNTKFKASPTLTLFVDKKALDIIKSDSNVENAEDDHLVFATTDSIGFSPNPITTMGGNASNGFYNGESWYNGSGYSVAILDTGVNRGHQKLQGKVVSEACYSYPGAGWESLCPNGQTSQFGTGAAEPCNYYYVCIHGTHVASEAALDYQSVYHSSHVRMNGNNLDNFTVNDAYYYNLNGWLGGGAKDAKIVAVQVFSLDRNNKKTSSANAAWLAGVDWVVANKNSINPPPAAINLSLGGGGYDSDTCYTSTSSYRGTIKAAKNAGIAVFISAGNGWDDGQLNNVAAPSCTVGAITVAASNVEGNYLADYSQNGKDTQLIAVGGDSQLTDDFPWGAYGGGSTGLYPSSFLPQKEVWGAFAHNSGDLAWTGMQGTSMASPYAAGIYTSIKSSKPDAKPALITNIMQVTGNELNDSRSGATTGYRPVINGSRAMQALRNTGAQPVIRYFRTSNKTANQNNATKVTLSGRVTGASKCTISNKVGNFTPDSNGNFSITNVIATYDYDLTCVNSANNAYANYYLDPNLQVEPTGINANDMTVYTDAPQNINPTFSPSNTSNKNLDYSSANTNIATVNADGRVEGKSPGSTTITMKSWAVESLTKTINITVKRPVTGISVNPTTWNNAQINETKQINLTVSPSDATDKSVTYSSNNTSVATVNSSGLVTAKGAGSTTITVRSNDRDQKTATFTVSVDKAVSSVRISDSSKNHIFVRLSNFFAFSCEVLPADAGNKNVTWTSSDPSIVAFNQSSNPEMAQAISPGTVTITVRTQDGGFTDTTQATVSKEVQSIAISPKAGEIRNDTSLQMLVAFTPVDASNQNITWQSENPAVASVDSTNGLVTAHSIGTTTIRAKSDESPNSVFDEASIEVYQRVNSLSVSPSQASMLKGSTLQLNKTISPSSAKYQGVAFSSSDFSIASVSSDGLVTAVNGGFVTITATTLDGTQLTAHTNIEVMVSAQGISLNPKPLSRIRVGEVYQYQWLFSPLNTTNQNVSFSSSNPSAVSVTNAGQITGLAVGNATITITTEGGGFTDSQTLSADRGITQISISPKSVVIPINNNYTFSSTVLPDSAPIKTVQYSLEPTDPTASINPNTGVFSSGNVPRENVLVVVRPTDNMILHDDAHVRIVRPVNSVALSPSTAQIGTEKTQALSSTVLPSDATDKTLTYSSSNESVATVDENGIVTGHTAGTATITAKSIETVSGHASAEASITVVQSVTSVDVSPHELQMNVGDSSDLSVAVYPTNAYNKNFTISSSDPTVVSTSSPAHLTALKGGTAIITITTLDGAFQIASTVHVYEAVSSVTISPKGETVCTGKSIQMSSTVLPNSASNKEVTYSTTSTDKADVDPNTGLVTIKSDVSDSDIVIRATSLDNPGAFDNATLHIRQSVKGVTLNPSTASVLPDGHLQLTPEFTPSNAYDQSVTYVSSHPLIATVDDNGLVTGLVQGETVITVITHDGTHRATSNITVEKSLQEITVDPHFLTLNSGGSFTPSITFNPPDAYDKKVSFSSSNENVAIVSEDGVVTAIGSGDPNQSYGSATITVTSDDGGHTDECTVTVMQAADGVQLTPESQTINKDQTLQLSSTVTPANAYDKAVTYRSSDASIATVDYRGIVTGRSNGSATITVTTNDGGHTDTAQITVIVPVTNIQVLPETASVRPYGFLQLETFISPQAATNKDIIFSSSDEQKATVDETGLVSVPGPDAGIPGQVTITARTVDGSFEDTCIIRIPEIVRNVILGPSNSVLRIGTPNNTVQMQPVIEPNAAEDKSVRYYSSDSNIASVSPAGLVTAGYAPGFVNITVVTNDNNLSDYVAVEVQQPVTGVDIFPSTIQLGLNRVGRVIPTVLPYLASNKTVTYYSADPSIATVDPNGIVKGISKGETDIFAKTNDGEFLASSHVTVVSSVTGVTLTEKSATLQLGQKLQMHANVLPADAPNKAVKYSTSNPSVAVVSVDGLVETVSPGNAVITVMTLDGYYEDTAQIVANNTPYNSSSIFDVLGSLFE
ncbi:MAG: Ig-like domain-containing protein [Bifidobacteriaceae bacterium]|jgi:uncharacterized protein YjdB|nr:Ig-like domain-containing protein [Bifidobacteriaceae bacterium]